MTNTSAVRASVLRQRKADTAAPYKWYGHACLLTVVLVAATPGATAKRECTFDRDIYLTAETPLVEFTCAFYRGEFFSTQAVLSATEGALQAKFYVGSKLAHVVTANAGEPPTKKDLRCLGEVVALRIEISALNGKGENGAGHFDLNHERIDLCEAVTKEMFQVSLKPFLEENLIGQPLATEGLTNVGKKWVAGDIPKSGGALFLWMLGPLGTGKRQGVKAFRDATFKHHTSTGRGLLNIDLAVITNPDDTHEQFKADIHARIKRQFQRCSKPFFSFDNFHKAPPHLLLSLLEMINKPTITIEGTEYNFAHSVVFFIATISDPDAEIQYRQSPDMRQRQIQQGPANTVTALKRKLLDATSQELAPYMEHVVPFIALDKATLRSIITKEIEGLTQLGVQENYFKNLIVPDEVVEFFIIHGDPAQGASQAHYVIEKFWKHTFVQYGQAGVFKDQVVTVSITDADTSNPRIALHFLDKTYPGPPFGMYLTDRISRHDEF